MAEQSPAHVASAAERQEGRACLHHWVIAQPNGRTSAGACKKCGLKRDFSNSMDAPDYSSRDGSDWSSLVHN